MVLAAVQKVLSFWTALLVGTRGGYNGSQEYVSPDPEAEIGLSHFRLFLGQLRPDHAGRSFDSTNAAGLANPSKWDSSHAPLRFRNGGL